MLDTNYPGQAIALLAEIGVHQLAHSVWAFTDVDTASHAYIHHSRKPVALAAYAVVNPTFAAGRFAGYTLADMVDKAPSMDYAEYAALAMVCGASTPSFSSSKHRAEIFGNAVWAIIEGYSLGACFERVRTYGTEGTHYQLRPRGYNWDGDREAQPEALKAMRKSYRAMTPLQQVMVLTIMHLYCQGKDKYHLTGGCPTKIPAADAIGLLKGNDQALAAWGHLVSHYAGW